MLVYLSIALVTVLLISEGGMSQNIVGGWKSHSIDDSDIKDLSMRAMQRINQQSNDAFHMLPVKVLSAKSQVVAGMKYELEMLVGQTGCLKNEHSIEDVGVHDCKEKEGGRRQIYTVSIWQKPWEEFEEIAIKEMKDAA